jgi:hypothetical protein
VARGHLRQPPIGVPAVLADRSSRRPVPHHAPSVRELAGAFPGSRAKAGWCWCCRTVRLPVPADGILDATTGSCSRPTCWMAWRSWIGRRSAAGTSRGGTSRRGNHVRCWSRASSRRARPATTVPGRRARHHRFDLSTHGRTEAGPPRWRRRARSRASRASHFSNKYPLTGHTRRLANTTW